MVPGKNKTSKTLEGRSATFRVRGLGFVSLFFSLGCSKSDFFGLNCCTISCKLFFQKQKIKFLSRLGEHPLRPSFLFFFSLVFVRFFIYVIFFVFFWFFLLFLMFFLGFLDFGCFFLVFGRPKVTRVTVGRDTKVFEFVKLIFRP